MADDGIPVQKFLVIKTLADFQLFCGTADNGAFIGKKKFFSFYQVPAFFEKPGLTAFFHVEEDNARIYKTAEEKENQLSVMVWGGGIFVIRNIDVIQKSDITVKEQVYVQIEEFFRNLGYEVGEEADQRVGRAIAVFVGRRVEFPVIKLRHIDFFDHILRIVGFCDFCKKGSLIVRNRRVIGSKMRDIHGKNEKMKRLFCLCPLENREHGGKSAVKDFAVSAEQDVYHEFSPSPWASDSDFLIY